MLSAGERMSPPTYDPITVLVSELKRGDIYVLDGTTLWTVVIDAAESEGAEGGPVSVNVEFVDGSRAWRQWPNDVEIEVERPVF